MALVRHQGRSQDLSLIGLILVVVGIIAVSVPCLKLAVDQFFAWFS
ncbi:MAG TPA: hypothetical protein VNU97_07185 [Rhizomicrobium sp.]|nr:hypothetical protein [Rhizomicrobium sp.]